MQAISSYPQSQRIEKDRVNDDGSYKLLLESRKKNSYLIRKMVHAHSFKMVPIEKLSDFT